MNRNIIDAIGTLIKIQPTCLDDPYSAENFNHSAHYRNLEEYVKNLFANSFLAKTADEKRELWYKVFSHFGNATNPPDLMLRGGYTGAGVVDAQHGLSSAETLRR